MWEMITRHQRIGDQVRREAERHAALDAGLAIGRWDGGWFVSGVGDRGGRRGVETDWVLLGGC